MKVMLTILGEPASKANSREIATIGAKLMDVVAGKNTDGTLKLERMRVGGRITNRKSDKALAYEEDALRQIPPTARLRLEGPVRVTLRIFYSTQRPDLDESVVLDVLQDRFVKDKRVGERVLVQKGVYRNDRQVREKHVFHAIDRNNPRAEVEVEPLEAQQAELEHSVPEPRMAIPRELPF